MFYKHLYYFIYYTIWPSEKSKKKCNKENVQDFCNTKWMWSIKLLLKKKTSLGQCHLFSWPSSSDALSPVTRLLCMFFFSLFLCNSLFSFDCFRWRCSENLTMMSLWSCEIAKCFVLPLYIQLLDSYIVDKKKDVDNNRAKWKSKR